MKRFVAIAACGFALSGCNPFESRLVSACEEVLMERLRAPSTYKRIRVEEYETALTQGDYITLLDTEIRRASSAELKEVLRADRDGRLAHMVRGDTKPTSYAAEIEYDAANGFGVPIRGLAKCTFTSDVGDKSKANKFFVRVDGKTQTEWLIERVESVRQ